MTDPNAHRPPNQDQLDHARHHVRSALSALRAINAAAVSAAEHERLARLAATLSDAAAELAECHT